MATTGCLPFTLALQCKGPGDTDWHTVNRKGFDFGKKEVTRAELQSFKSNWESQGIINNHHWRIIEVNQ